jgi:tripartite-type tricarboxylate transporter receptor subunit TctC
MNLALRVVAATAIGIATSASSVFAQDYPKSPIRFINASSAGGASDIFIRALGEQLTSRLKQPIIVENKPGGAFNIATRACADADPNGYTFCVIPGEVFIYNPLLFKKLPFDPDTSVDPIMALFFVPQVLAVRADLNVKTVDELAALAKAKPKVLSYSSPGVAQAAYVESFINRDKGADLVKVPFRGGGEAVNGIMTGTTPVAFIGVGNLISHFEAKTIVGLVVDGTNRVAALPDVPTVSEAGFKGDMVQPFFALYAPPKTPKDIVDRVRKEISLIISDENFIRKNIDERGLSSTKGTIDELKNLIASGRSAAKRIVDEAGLTPQ